MRCDSCLLPEPAAPVRLSHNVGMLFMRREYSTEGELCRSCLNRALFHHTLRNVTLGWWGTISFCMTWYFLFSNLVNYFRARSELGQMKPREAPRPPASGDEAARVLQPFEHNIRMQLRMGDSPGDIAREMARIHRVDAASAERFVASVQASEAEAVSEA
ncbi:hypothetical protein DRW03_31425 [Corallococcus sp. H22C18031201]|nr:hypothetical protein DRW03_31425 [Corallococcus sp. H22C18031201]